METTIINGKEIARWIKEEVSQLKDQLVEETGVIPGLAVILVGEDPASAIYVKNKTKSCKKMGFTSELIQLEDTISTEDLLAHIELLNRRDDIHGILVQLPLPPQIDRQKVLDLIRPEKDVDGFHPVNSGRLLRGDFTLVPCTPAGIMKLFQYLKIEVRGKEVVIIGRSDIVGKPLALLLLHSHATVTLCHSRTVDLPGVARRADILVTAMGRPGFVGPEFVKEGATVIDVGTSRIEMEQTWPELLEEGTVWKKSLDSKGYAVVGDVRFQQLLGHARAVTPVPGGIGPLTIAMLLHNTVAAARSLAEKR